MKNDDENWFDSDIDAMELGWGEKAGLQIYRNYTKSFEAHALKRFAETLDREELDLSDLQRLVDSIVEEDLRFLPVIMCAYADELLERVFKTTLPDNIPGGRADLFSGFGPLATLSQRIRLAFAFDVLSADLMLELDRLRSARNKISHNWDADTVTNFHLTGRVADMVPVDQMLVERAQHFNMAPELQVPLDDASAFRVRLAWLAARFTYEAAAWNRAKQARLIPMHALYQEPITKWLTEVSRISMGATRKIANIAQK